MFSYIFAVIQVITKKHIYSFLIVCFAIFSFQQPSTIDVNAKIKSVFIYNFTRYFEWPKNKQTGMFTIYVVGKNDNLVNELKSLASKKKVGNQDIEIKTTSTFDANNLANSQIVYFLNDATKSQSDGVSKSKGKGLLVVSESAGLCKQGSAINFTVVDNKVKFEYNKNNAIKLGLKTNDDFKALAINIE